MPMFCVWAEKDHRLTGRYRSRPGTERLGIFSRRLVFITQVEETFVSYEATYGRNAPGEAMTRWRDATWKDLSIIRVAPSAEENAA